MPDVSRHSCASSVRPLHHAGVDRTLGTIPVRPVFGARVSAAAPGTMMDSEFVNSDGVSPPDLPPAASLVSRRQRLAGSPGAPLLSVSWAGNRRPGSRATGRSHQEPRLPAKRMPPESTQGGAARQGMGGPPNFNS